MGEQRWKPEVFFDISFPFVRVRRCSLLAEEEVCLFRRPSWMPIVCRSGTGNGCVFLLEPRCLRLKARQNERREA